MKPVLPATSPENSRRSVPTGEEGPERARASQPSLSARQNSVFIAIVALVLTVLCSAGWLTHRNMVAAVESDRWLQHSYVVREELGALLSSLTDAETDQRGYIITGDRAFLEQYAASLGPIEQHLTAVRRLTADSPERQQHLAAIASLVAAKLAVLAEVIAVREKEGIEAASTVIVARRGKEIMDEIRAEIGKAQGDEAALRQARLARKEAETRRTIRSVGFGGAVGGLVLLGLLIFLRRELVRRHRAETGLRLHQDHLNELVAERTQALEGITRELSAEIAERQRGEEVLRASEERFRAAVSISTSLLWTNNAEGMMEGEQPGWGGFTGQTREEYQGYGWAQAVHPEDAAPTVTAWQLAVAEKRRFEFEHRVRRHDGEWRRFTIRATPLCAADGTIREWVGVHTDITERQRAEAALRLSHERFDLAVKCSQVVLFQQDLELRYTWHRNPELGLKVSDFVGKRDADLMEHAADAAVTEGLKREVIRTGVGLRQEVLVHIQGVDRHYDLLVEPLWDSPGRIAGVTCAAIDITARKQAEAALREKEHFLERITQVTPGILHVFDLAERRTVFVNRTVASVLGFSPEEVEAMGSDVVPTLMHPEDLPRFEPHLARLCALADGEIADFELRMRDRAGAWHSFHSYDTVFARDAAGAPQQIIGVATENTERKRAEEAVVRLAAIVESSHDALFSEDLEGIVTSWNRGAEQIFGYRADEIIGTSIMRLIPEARQEAEHEMQRNLAAGERGGTFEAIRKAKDGREFHASITISPLKDAAGKIIGTSRVVRDITDRKRAEEALRRNAALFSTLIVQAPVGTYVVDAQFRVREANAEAMPVFVSVQPLIGRDFEEVMEIVWGPEVGGRCAAIFRHTLETGERYVSPPFTEKRHDLGIEQTYEWETRRVTLPEGEHSVVCYFHEVTERARAAAALRASEERMRLAAETTGVGIWEWNVLTGFIHWDGSMFQIYGVAPTADGFVSYDTWRRAVMPEDLAHQEEVLMDTVRQCGQSTREFRILRADNGECRWIQAVELVRPNSEGKAEWVVGTNFDVTEQKKAEIAIREEARRKDEFLAMLGHELRNPLNAIRHAVQISGETPDDAEACQWAAKVVDRQSQQLSRMVDDLLDVARINRGRIDLRVEALDLGPVLEQAIAVVRPILAQRRQNFTSDIGSPLRVTGDAVRLQQVFGNLLTNAAKYTPENGRISLRAQNEDGEIVVTITDNGVGIPAELLPHVFDLFRQADCTLDRAMGGLGIGLNVVKSLVEMHLGRVTVESAGANAGTTVTVRLPLLLELPAAERPPAPPALAATPPKAVRVLVVDDHEDAAQALARLLKRRGCEVRCAHTGPDGVTTAREFLPEVLLLDIGLPGLDGYELAHILRAEAPFADALFIAISGYAQDGDRRRCLASGFDDHFAKPLDIPKLMEAIHARCLA